MALLQTLNITQPYYLYEEENAYNVIPAIISLNFDSLPSQDSTDYQCIADFGSIYAQFTLYFQQYSTNLNILAANQNPNIQFSGNSVLLTMNITFDSGCTVQPYYQGSKLPYTLYAKQDPSYMSPAIWNSLYTPHSP